MGGRGSASRLGASKQFSIPKVTGAQLKAMGRKQLETLASAIFTNKSVKAGLSQAEGLRRAESLLGGNSDAQLRHYISKYGKEFW